MVEAGGVEPPSEDSTLRAATCVSGLFDLVVRDPGRQGSLLTIPVEFRPVAPRERAAGYPVKVTPFRLYGHSAFGRSRAKPRELQDSRWRLFVFPLLTRVRGLGTRPGSIDVPVETVSPPFKPDDSTSPGRGIRGGTGIGSPAPPRVNGPRGLSSSPRSRCWIPVRRPSGTAANGSGTGRRKSAGSRRSAAAPRCPPGTLPG